jgi:predicted nucleic acid-binding protein
LDVEIVQARRLVSSSRAHEAIGDLTDLDLHRHAHVDLVSRAWKLRDNIGAYDALYIALAERLKAPVVTCDRPAAQALGHRARIEVIG